MLNKPPHCSHSYCNPHLERVLFPQGRIALILSIVLLLGRRYNKIEEEKLKETKRDSL